MLRSFTAHEPLNGLYQYQITAVSENADINLDDLIGKTACVELELFPQGQRYFHGYVSDFSYTGVEGNFSTYELTLRPFLWFLSKTADCRVFQNKDVKTIIKTLCAEHGFTDIQDKLIAAYRTWDYCVQYRESALNFISRLMEQEGIYYYFEHTAGKHTLVLADDISAHKPFPGYEQVPLYLEDIENRHKVEHLSSWRCDKSLKTGKFTLTDYDFTKPKASLEVKSSIARAHAQAAYEYYDYPGEYSEAGDGEHYVKQRIQARQAGYETLSGSGSVRGFVPGYLFTLTESPRAAFNQQYLILSVSHQLKMDAYASGANHFRYATHLKALSAKEIFRPLQKTPKPSVRGLQSAVVVGPAGEEIYTDQYGRVKVQFHWDRLGKKDENSSCWVRVSHPWAGKHWGMIATPRIGQEVMISFLEGDPDQPLIVGRVYNYDQMPPYELPRQAAVTGMKSDTHKGSGYNEISIDDSAGKEKITIHGQKDMNTVIEHDQTLTVGNDRATTIKNNEKNDILGSKKATVQGPYDIKVASDCFKVVCGGSELILKDSGTIEITGTKITLSASGSTIKLDGAGVAINGVKISLN